jgi:hypothetical protein
VLTNHVATCGNKYPVTVPARKPKSEKAGVLRCSFEATLPRAKELMEAAEEAMAKAVLEAPAQPALPEYPSQDGALNATNGAAPPAADGAGAPADGGAAAEPGAPPAAGAAPAANATGNANAAPAEGANGNLTAGITAPSVDVKKLSLALSGGGAAAAPAEPAAPAAPATPAANASTGANGTAAAPAAAPAPAPQPLDALEIARSSSGSLLPSNATVTLANETLPTEQTLEAPAAEGRRRRRRVRGAAAASVAAAGADGESKDAAAAPQHPPTAAALLPSGAASFKALLPAAKLLGDAAPLLNSAAPLLGQAGPLLSTAAKAAPLFKAAAPFMGGGAASAAGSPVPASVSGGALSPAAAARVEELLPDVLVTAEAQPAMPPGSALEAAPLPEAASPPYKALFEVPEKACVVVTEALSGPMAKYLLPSTVPAAARTICGGEGETLYDALLGNFDASACGENTLSNAVAGGATTATANVNVVGCNHTRVARPDITLTKLKFVRVVNHTWSVDAAVAPLPGRASNDTGDGSLALPAGGSAAAKFTVAVTKDPEPLVQNRIRVSGLAGFGGSEGCLGRF